ncbi:MAG: alpha/beta fold hydrolase [Salinisphaeraceae bacterium]|nr:alpha/beta fold hydrolase [Salinisphaeraceae bacterium]
MPNQTSAIRPGKWIYFAHGKESGPWGKKISRLADSARKLGWEVESPDYSHTHNPHERVAQLLDINPQCNGPLVLVGSSMGAYVAAQACARLKPAGLFLLAPALYFPGWDEEPQGCPKLTTVVHGWDDDIVPLDAAIRFSKPRKAALHVLDSGHTLNDQLPALERLFTDFLQQVEAAS